MIKGNSFFITNPDNIQKDDIFEEYLYLDTSSLTKNNLSEFEVFHDKSLLPSRAKRIVKHLDILYSTVRPKLEHHGILVNPPENLLVSTGFTVIRVDKEKVNPYYFYYQLTKKETLKRLILIANTSVSSYPSITAPDIENLLFDLPDIQVQNKFGKSLENIDKKIKINRDLINLLEKQLENLFLLWFVDFNFPNNENKPYKLNGGKFQIVNSKELPKGWKFTELRNFVQSTHNGDWGKDEFEEGDQETYCIRGTDIPFGRNGVLKNVPVRYIKGQKPLNHGDIIIEASGGSDTQSTGRTMIVRDSMLKSINKPLYFSNFSKAIKPKKEYSLFLYQLLNYLYKNNYFFYFEGKTSGIRNLLLDSVLNRISFAEPPLEILMKFEKSGGLLIDKIYALGMENEVLIEAREKHIKKYF